MKAVVSLDQDKYSVEDITLDPPKSGEVKVKIAACGVCHSDLSVVKARALLVETRTKLVNFVRGTSKSVGERMPGCLTAAKRAEPKEAIRCRVCRRSMMELVVGVDRAAVDGERVAHRSAVEVVSRCHSCHRQARIAWSDARRSKQEIKLDLLYGRR